MITLNDETEYYILVDGQGGTFGGGRICEGKIEVFEQFQEWADADNMQDPTLKNYTFSDLIDIWEINIKKYDGREFRELLESELTTTII